MNDALAKVGAEVNEVVAEASAEFDASLVVELEVTCVACAVLGVGRVVDQEPEIIHGVGAVDLDAEVLEIVAVGLNGGFIHGEAVKRGGVDATGDVKASAGLGDAHPARAEGAVFVPDHGDLVVVSVAKIGLGDKAQDIFHRAVREGVAFAL